MICYECDPNRAGGYNHVKCRNGKHDLKGKLQKCDCYCQARGYVSKRTRIAK
jgi:hypothetical protein